jgi:hypothetical protein
LWQYKDKICKNAINTKKQTKEESSNNNSALPFMWRDVLDIRKHRKSKYSTPDIIKSDKRSDFKFIFLIMDKIVTNIMLIASSIDIIYTTYIFNKIG